MSVSAGASASFASASTSGVVEFHSSAGQENSATADSRAMYQTYVRVSGRIDVVESARMPGNHWMFNDVDEVQLFSCKGRQRVKG